MFLHEGIPGDELKVVVSTAARPEITPKNPLTVFKLSATSDAFLVRERFSVVVAPVIRKRKPERSHIIRLD